ncbi:MAG: HPP family protein [Pseudomonadota bacterium]
MNRILLWLKDFIPTRSNAGKREQFYACLGVGISLMLTEWLSHFFSPNVHQPWFIASIASSAMLLFAVPSSPFAQPWAIVGGNIVSALVGIACVQWIDNTYLAASTAGALAIAIMFALRCMHPPGAAVALTAVVGGPTIQAMGYQFAWSPVGTNSLLLLLIGLIFNNVLHRRYPHRQSEHVNSHRTNDLPSLERLGFSHPDFIQALAEHKELLDINQDDLEELLLKAEMHAHRRHFKALQCSDIMSKDIICINTATSPEEAWRLLQKHTIEALPVTNEHRQLIGIITQYDLALTKYDKSATIHAYTIESLMQKNIITAHPEQALVELVPLFINKDVHHLPVVDGQQNIIGMVAQSDILAALFRARYEENPIVIKNN